MTGKGREQQDGAVQHGALLQREMQFEISQAVGEEVVVRLA